jgi:hypothetical protein
MIDAFGALQPPGGAALMLLWNGLLVAGIGGTGGVAGMSGT